MLTTRARKALLQAALVASGLATWGVHALPAESAAVVPPGEIIEDRTPEMWSIHWWMWAASFRGSESPIADREGVRCGAGQEGATFLLAGAYGSASVQRTCTIPHGKYIFFPLVNYIVMAEGAQDCDGLKSEARSAMDKPAALFAELDGKAIAELESRRAAPRNCFNVNARSKGPAVTAAANGYWVMLRPLSAGRHTLHFGGEVDSFGQDITYTLVAE